MGDLNTAGSGWLWLVGLPSAPAMVTVGRVAIVQMSDYVNFVMTLILTSSTIFNCLANVRTEDCTSPEVAVTCS